MITTTFSIFGLRMILTPAVKAFATKADILAIIMFATMAFIVTVSVIVLSAPRPRHQARRSRHPT